MISRRLIEVAKYTKGFNHLLDVGSDHAYLPIYAMEKGLIRKATASDIGEGPILNARKNILEAKLDIDTIIYDGIPQTNADVVCICGMGGELIKEILKKTLNNVKNVKRLILAPNTDVIMLRNFITSIGFKLVDEDIIKEKNHFYEILVLEKGQVPYSKEELFFGPFLLKKKKEEFVDKYTKRLKKLNSIIDGITEKLKKEEIKEEIEFIKKLF